MRGPNLSSADAFEQEHEGASAAVGIGGGWSLRSLTIRTHRDHPPPILATKGEEERNRDGLAAVEAAAGFAVLAHTLCACDGVGFQLAVGDLLAAAGAQHE